MSEPVTNVEIEDVLSSIRKLVSDGDKARTRDPASIEPVVADVEVKAEAAVPAPESKPEKLVLSPAFMVVGSQDDVAVEADAEETAPEPLNLSDPIVEEDTENSEADEGDLVDAVDDEVTPEAEASVQSTDRSSLVETIAELEAAVSGDAGDFEPDGSEDLGETIAWPGAMMRQPKDIEDAEMADESDAYEDDAPAEDEPVAFTHREEAANDDASEADVAPDAEDDADAAADVYEDDDLDDLLEAGGVTLDEAALRQLVSDVVREELTGPLGERITRNVRKLVRREIYRILSSQEFD